MCEEFGVSCGNRGRAVCAAAIALVLCGYVSGCSKNDPNSGMYSKAAIVIAVDHSVPGQAGRDWQSTQLTSLEKSASEAHYLFDLWSYSSQPVHLWGPGELLDSDQADSASAAQLAPIALSVKRATAPALLLEAIANERSLSALPYCRILILTDGYVSSPAGWNEISSAARLFTGRPGWRIELLGVEPQYDKPWNNALAPTLAGRYQLVPQALATRLLQENHDE